MATCCPIRSKVLEDASALPEDGSKTGIKTGEAMSPAARGMQNTEQNVHKQRRPDLPLNGITIMPEEGPQVQRLLDLLKKGLDGPAALVQVANARWRPVQVVREEDHLLVDSVVVDNGRDSPHALGVGTALSAIGDHDYIIS